MSTINHCNQCGLQSEIIFCDGDFSVCFDCHERKQYEKGYNTALQHARLELENAYQAKNLITFPMIDGILMQMRIAKAKPWRVK